MKPVCDKGTVDGGRALISAEENRRMFDGISRRYDLLNRIISLGMDRTWRRKAVDQLLVKRGGHYVDAGCGTGALSMEIGSLLGRDAVRVSGFDVSTVMLEEGVRRVRAAGLEQCVSLCNSDVLAMPLADATVDGVISGFVIRNIVDRPGALAEWSRVLKPGGRCVVLELAIPERPLARLFYRMITRLLVPTAGFILSRHRAYVYLLESIRTFPSTDVVLAMFRDARFLDVQSMPLTFGAVRIYRGTKP